MQKLKFWQKSSEVGPKQEDQSREEANELFSTQGDHGLLTLSEPTEAVAE
jgi:hypothetical protein